MKKKIFSLISCLTMTTSVFAQAEYFTYQQIEEFSEEIGTIYGLEITGIASGVTLPSTVTIPETADYEGLSGYVVSIGERALCECDNVAYFDLSESSNLRYIKDYAFENCKGLNKVSFSSSVIKIGANPFLNCPSLENIDIDNSLHFKTYEYCLYSIDLSTLIAIPSGIEFTDNTYTAPTETRIIGESAISGTKNLTKIIMSPQEIADGNFTMCEGLEEVYITSSSLEKFMVSSLQEGVTFFLSTTTTPETETYANYSHCNFVVTDIFYETNKYESPWTSADNLATRADYTRFNDNLLDFDHHALYVETLNVTLNFSHTGPRSACLSFPIPVSTLNKNGIEAYELCQPDYLEEIDGGYILKFEKLTTGNTPIMTPLVFRRSVGKTITFSIPNTLLPKEQDMQESIVIDDELGISFTMTMVESSNPDITTLPTDPSQIQGAWALGGGMFGKVSTSASIQPHRWYVYLPQIGDGNAAPKRLMIRGISEKDEDKESDSIDNTSTSILPMYNLNGQRVADPSHLNSGLYIQGTSHKRILITEK